MAKKAVKKSATKPLNKEQAKKKALQELSKAKAKFVSYEKRVLAYIKKHPSKAVAIAAGLGAAIGAVALARKRKR